MLDAISRFFKNLRKKNKYKRLYYSGQEMESSGNIAFTNVPYGSFNQDSDHEESDYGSADQTNVKSTGPSKRKEDTREVKKPVEVVGDIVAETPALNLTDLPHQIKLVKYRMKVLNEQGIRCTDEHVALKFLEARKKYEKHKDLFSKWPITTNEKIQALLKRYKLRTSDLQPNYKNIPMEAINEMEQYAKAHAKITDEHPQYALIMDIAGPETKKDPILLVQSPFGRWWYILGAWDKEVEVVDDLVYKGK